MDDIVHRPLPFHRQHSIEMEIHSAKLRSFSTSTPTLTHGFLSDSKVTRSMSTSSVNDSGFDESFMDCHDNTINEMPSTVCKYQKWTPIMKLQDRDHNDSFLDHGYGSGPFSNKSNYFFKTPGATFFSNSSGWRSLNCQEINQSLRQSVSIPTYSLDIDPEPRGMVTDNATSNLVERFDEVMHRFSPPDSKKVIGRKMGLECVDIIAELADKDISSLILQYLQPDDLCRMCEVSNKWKSVCYSDVRTKRQKNRYSPYKHDKVATGKENFGKKSPPRPLRGLTDGQNTLASLQPVGEIRSEPTLSSIKVNLFQKVASSLKNEEKLRKCPRCSKVSKVLPVQERGQCQNDDCQFDFCINCFYEFHGSRPCIPVAAKKTKTSSIGGKKSKKNLRRL